MLLVENGFPEGHPFRSVRAMPADVVLPPIFVYDAACVMLSYRKNFKPSAALARPCVILGTAAIAADTDVRAERIAASAELHYVRRAQGEYPPLESPEAVAAYPYTPSDRERLARHRARLAVGSADRVKDRPLALADATRACEIKIIVTTMVFDHAARRHSYELLAKAFALPQ